MNITEKKLIQKNNTRLLIEYQKKNNCQNRKNFKNYYLQNN